MQIQTERRNAQRGFTLTEIAIVLGIIGLILSAIWVAYAAVSNNLKSSRSQQQILQIVQGVRGLYGAQSSFDANATITSIAASGVLPTDVVTGTTPNVNPWGGKYIVNTGSTGSNLVVGMTDITQKGCIALILGLTGTSRDVNLAGYAAGITVNAETYKTETTDTQFPVTATNAATACQGKDGEIGVAFTFKK